MSNHFVKLWHDPVWSKVIATSIIALAGVVITYSLNLWSAIGQLPQSLYLLAISRISLPLWIIVTALILALPFVIFIFAFVWRKYFAEITTQITWHSYNKDMFFGVCWRWKYANDNGTILDQDVHAFCPHCDYQVHPIKSNSFDAIDRFVLYCDSCDKPISEFNERYVSLINKVKRFIQQKIRNGEWKK